MLFSDSRKGKLSMLSLYLVSALSLAACSHNATHSIPGKEISSLPKPARLLLEFTPTVLYCKKTIESIVYDVSGYSYMIGTGKYPGSIKVVPAKSGGSYITWTIDPTKTSIISLNSAGWNALANAVIANLDSSVSRLNTSELYNNSYRKKPSNPISSVATSEYHRYGLVVLKFWISENGERVKVLNKTLVHVHHAISTDNLSNEIQQYETSNGKKCRLL